MRRKYYITRFVIGIICMMVVTICCNIIAFAVDTKAPVGNNAINAWYKISFATLHDSSEEKIYLVIENTSENPINVNDISPICPQYISIIEIDKKNSKFSIDAGQSKMIPYTIKTEKAIKPGKDTLFFDIQFSGKNDGKNISFNKLLSVDLVIGVTASDNLLTIFGVPTFLLIPGIIFVSVFLCFSNFNIIGKKDIDVKNPVFWVMSTTASIVIIILYQLISRLTGENNQDLLKSYGLVDIIFVWFFSIALAAASLVLIKVFTKIYKGRKTFSDSDEPLTIIEKVSIYQKSLKLDLINIISDKEERQMCLLPGKSGDLYACNQISIAIKEDKTKEKNAASINDKLKDIILNKKNIKKLKRFIKKNKDFISLIWKENADIQIKKVKEGEFKRTEKKDFLVVYK